MGYLLAALLGGFLVFNSQATPEKAAEVMQQTLQQRFPGATVEAQVEGKRGRDILKGRFRRVQIRMANFRTGGAGSAVPGNAPASPPTLRAIAKARSTGRVGELEADLRNFQFGDLQVEALNAHFQDVVFDWKVLKKESRIDMVSCGPTVARLSLSPAALEVLMRDKLMEISEAKLSFQGNKLQVSGKRNIPLIGLPVPFTLTGSLEARSGNEVWLTQPALKMSGVPVAAPIASTFLRNINPLYVFDKERAMPFRVMISNIQNRDGTLELTGQLQFVPAAPLKQ